MTTAKRSTHLIGSVPAADAAAAMTMAREHLGDSLRCLPDGETGERYHWIINVIEGMRQHPDLEVSKEGDWSDYDKTPVFKVRKGHKLAAGAFDFGTYDAYRSSLPAYREAVADLGGSAPPFQVGVPGDLDMTMFVFGPKGVPRYRRTFRAVTLNAIRRVQAEAGTEAVFQIEVPVELVAVAQVPGPIRPLVAGYLGRGIARLAVGAPVGTRFGVHLCLGDMNHKALATMTNVEPVVLLANAIAKAWPSDRPLEFVHVPFAGASQPPPTDAAFYEPLRRLRLPGGTRLVAGLVYEHQSIEEQRRVLQIVETAYGRAVDLSAACGLGRRTTDEAQASMQRARLLTEM